MVGVVTSDRQWAQSGLFVCLFIGLSVFGSRNQAMFAIDRLILRTERYIGQYFIFSMKRRCVGLEPLRIAQQLAMRESFSGVASW